MMVQTNTASGDSMIVRSGSETFVWNPRIADMLNFTPEQRDQMRTLLQDFRTLRPQSGIQGIQGMAQRLGELRERVNQSLRPEQRTRFGETTFQLAGGLDSPFLNERTLEVLELTDSQKEQIRKIVAEREAEAVAARLPRGGYVRPENVEAFNAAATERNKKYAEQIKAVLTADQRARAEKLTAEIPALRERLGMAREGLTTSLRDRLDEMRAAALQRGGRELGQERREAPAYTPGDGSWQPGQEVPNGAPDVQRGTFPRGED